MKKRVLQSLELGIAAVNSSSRKKKKKKKKKKKRKKRTPGDLAASALFDVLRVDSEAPDEDEDEEDLIADSGERDSFFIPFKESC